jgi:hypothetical protein
MKLTSDRHYMQLNNISIRARMKTEPSNLRKLGNPKVDTEQIPVSG